MDRRRSLSHEITRRGFVVGMGLVAAPFVIRSRATSVQPITLGPDRRFPRAELLISPATLQARLDTGTAIRLLDVSNLATYRERHIPGAVHAWWQDTMELNADYYGMVLKPDDDKGNQHRRVRLLERLGIASADQIVVYGAGDPRDAARICWFLRFLGFNSAVVDGGLAGWLGLPAATSNSEASVVETHAPQISPTAGYYLFASEAVPLIGSQRVQFVDVRNSDERASGPYRNLAIPGAMDLPRSSLAYGPLLGAPGELTRLFHEAGIDLARHLILIGPTGLDTATAWLALSLMGATEVTIVDGGWSQWLDTPGAPRTG